MQPSTDGEAGPSNETAPKGSAGRLNTAVDHGVAWIELDNPDKLNAISVNMWRQLIAALGSYEKDTGVRCVVLAGKGAKAFCTGADIAEKEVAGADAADNEALALEGLSHLRAFSKPIIAAINGYCLGAGLALATVCDLRVAGKSARFGIPAARLGLAVYYDVLVRIARLIGPSKAKWLLFTADRIKADEALRAGLIDREVADEEVNGVVRELAILIAGNAPMTIATAKCAIDMAFMDPADRNMAAYIERERACYESEDFVEGRRAFLEKRRPDFKGR
jgi:enoyl-CoA hydratase